MHTNLCSNFNSIISDKLIISFKGLSMCLTMYTLLPRCVQILPLTKLSLHNLDLKATISP